ncbi:MAG: ABC transporter permease [Ignavibacteriales bacterium]|nr:ABC transporter permease [Ignavibacteriales bacterium]
MNFEFFIAKRYLLSKHKLNFITIISIVSSIGITLGVAALIIVLSVFNGFGDLVTSILVNFDPHIRITSLTDGSSNKLEQLGMQLNKTNHIISYTPFVEGKTIIKCESRISIVDLKGFDYKSENTNWGFKSSLKYGKYNLNDNEDGIIIGLNLATKLQSLIGDSVAVTSFNNLSMSALTYAMPITKKYIVKGIFESNNNDYDLNYVFTSLKSAQDLLGLKDEVQGIEIRLDDIKFSNEIKTQLERNVNKNEFSISSWYDLHKDLYSMMQIERWVAYIILSLIIAVATFNVLGSLSMSVIEKKQDIGILRSMGVKDKSILRIFMFEGVLIGIIGTIAGSLIGLMVVLLQEHFKLYPLDPTRYIIDALPVQLRLSDFLAVAGMSFFLSFIASLYPAKRATKIALIDAIKWE